MGTMGVGQSQVGKAGKIKKSSAEQGLLDASSNLLNAAYPVTKEVMGQTLEALQTGGIGARLPIAQKAVEGSRAATSSAMSQLDASLATQGMGRSSFGNQLRASTLLQGELATQAIPTDIAQQFIAAAPTMALGFGGQGLQGISGATAAANTRKGIESQRDIAKGNQNAQIISSIWGAMGSAVCWVAAALYGWYTPEWYAARRTIMGMRGPHGRLVRWAYLRYGERLARHRWACEVLRPLFDLAVRRGLK